MKWITYPISTLFLLLIIWVCLYHLWPDVKNIQKVNELVRPGISRDEANQMVNFQCGVLNGILFLLILLWGILFSYEKYKKRIKKTNPRKHFLLSLQSPV